MKTIAIDFDGVLTDGKQYLGDKGKFFATHARDNWAIAQLIEWGYQVDLVTANDSPIVKHYAEGRKMGYVLSIDKNLQYDIVIVDSIQDKLLIEESKISFCPRDSDLKVLVMVDNIVPVNAGHGVINYIVQNLNHLL